MELTTVELFAGIGGFRLAADNNKFRTVWANEIEPKACSVYRDQFGTKELVEGDIRKWKQDIPAHDVLTGGFPCQPFSSAGKKEGTRDPRGTLFQEIVDVIKARQPQYFVLENVKRLLSMEKGKHFATIISSLADLNYGIEWRLLNAVHFALPQNRQRVFLIGTRLDQCKADLPNARLVSSIDLAGMTDRQQDLARDSSNWKPIAKHTSGFQHWGIATNGRFFAVDLDNFSEQSKVVPVRSVLQRDVSDEFDFTDSTLKWLSNNSEVNKYVGGVEIISNQAGGARMGYTIFGINGVAPTLTSTTSRHYERYKIGERYRRLTNVEYARIQGFPDSHCRKVSVYDQYALIGNAVPPPMAGWVMNRLRLDGICLRDTLHVSKQRELLGVPVGLTTTKS